MSVVDEAPAPLTAVDRLLQDWRIHRARRWLRRSDRVLDVGCADGALFRRLDWLSGGVGIDPNAEPDAASGAAGVDWRLHRGFFPDDLPKDIGRFDAIVALAVFEHVPEDQGAAFAASCRRLLRPGGRLVISVPAPFVDRMLHVLARLRLVAGMEMHQHWGLVPADVPAIFGSAGFVLHCHQHFELRLNHLFVFTLPAGTSARMRGHADGE